MSFELALLGATSEQDDNSVPILAEINPITWPDIYLALRDS